MGGQNGKCSQSRDSDGLFPSDMEEEETASELMQRDPCCPASKSSEEGSTWVPEVGPRPNTLSSSSHIVHDPEINLSAWTPEDSATWTGSNPAALVGRSMQANSLAHQSKGQHRAATAASPFHCPTGPARPEPWLIPSLPRGFFNFLLEEEEQEADNSANPAEKGPVTGSPRELDFGLNGWGGQTRLRPKRQRLPCFQRLCSLQSQDSEPIRAGMVGTQRAEGSQTPNLDIFFSSEVEEEGTVREPVKQHPWDPAVKFSSQGSSWETEVGPWPNPLSSLSHFFDDPEVNLSALTPEEVVSLMESNIAGSVPRSRRANWIPHQDEGQDTAATAAAPLLCPMARARPEPWLVPTLPRDFFNFLLEEEEEQGEGVGEEEEEEKEKEKEKENEKEKGDEEGSEEEEEEGSEEEEEEQEEEKEEEEEEKRNNSTNPAKKTPARASPSGRYSGCFIREHRPPHDPSPELLLLYSSGQDLEPPAPPSHSFRPPVFRACRRRLIF